MENDAEKEYQKYIEKLVKNLGNNLKDKKDKKDKKDNSFGQLFIVSSGISSRTRPKPSKYGPDDRYNKLTLVERRKIKEVEKKLKDLNKHSILPRNKILLLILHLLQKQKY